MAMSILIWSAGARPYMAVSCRDFQQSHIPSLRTIYPHQVCDDCLAGGPRQTLALTSARDLTLKRDVVRDELLNALLQCCEAQVRAQGGMGMMGDGAVATSLWQGWWSYEGWHATDWESIYLDGVKHDPEWDSDVRRPRELTCDPVQAERRLEIRSVPAGDQPVVSRAACHRRESASFRREQARFGGDRIDWVSGVGVDRIGGDDVHRVGWLSSAGCIIVAWFLF